MTQAAKDLPNLFQKLSESILLSDDVICPLLADTLKLCLQDVTTESADIVISNAFDQKLGILSFLRSISAKQVLRRSISDSLDFIHSLIKKFGTQLKSFVKNIQEVCLQVYTVATVAELKCRALSTISEMLKTELATYCNDLLSVAKKLTSDFAKSDTHVKPTVKKEILVLLGQFCSCSPSSMSEISDSLAEKIISTLQYQMNRSRAPETAIISGCFLSLGYLLGPFDRSGYPEQVNTIFTCLAKGIDSSIKTTRYDIPKSALELMAKHGEQFRNHLLQNYEILYTRLREFTLMNNPEVKKIAMSATETFLRQVGAELADPWDDSLTEEKQRNIFGFFLKDFVTLMKSTSSNLRSVSQAIRSFGYFAAAFKKFQGEGEVRDMLTILLEKCIQVCTTEDETADSKAAFLPSFLQSLANIVKQIDMIDDGISESLTGIFSLTLNAYPTLAGAIHQSCTSAIIQFVYTICSMTQKPVRLLSDLVYQVLLRTCMHDPVIEGESLSILSEDGNKKISYKDYTQLWADLLSPRKYTAAIGITGVSSLENVVYGEMVKGLFRICDKLDLSTSSASVELEEGGENVTGTAINEPNKIKDYQILINLSDFAKVVLQEVKTENFNDWAFTYCHAIIKHSSKNPTVSSFYKLLTVAMVICTNNNYFELSAATDSDDMDILSESSAATLMTHQLVSKYQKKVVTCMKQYKDDLLISCLSFLFSLPVSIIKSNLDTTSEALQMGLSLGLSYPPLIRQCVNTLRLLIDCLEKHELVEKLELLLPYFDKFLQSSSQAENEHVDEIPRKVLKNKQRLKLPPALLRLAKEKTLSGRTEVQKLKLEVLAFLGSLGGELNHYVISSDRKSLAKLAVSWDTRSHLPFHVPFRETKADIYLDKFLPHTCELAMSSSNRQTKVVACELLHSFVILLLGNDATRPAGYSKKNSAEKIYSKLFPVLLSLSVDMEQVAKQLFEPLVFQLIHWFTKFPKRKETSLLLDTLMDGVESVNNSALREFSAMCVAEFLRWSIKHTSVEQQRKNPENVKQLLRRMFSMARHPGSGKRRGACFVYNHTYMILREEESLIDKFTMEILVCFIDCLACAHADDPSLETHQEAKKCLSHVERILKAKAQLFLEPSKQRRIPLGWTTCTLKDAILWLLSQVGRSETECRHACMDLISNLVPCLSPELNSRHKLIQYVVEKQGIQYIIDRCEAVPTTNEGKPGILQMSSPFRSEHAPAVKVCLMWFDKLLACLDAYCWFIGNGTLSASQLLAGRVGIFSVLLHFVSDVSMQSLHDLTAAKSGGVAYTPAEVDEYNRCKCTAIVRIFDFITIIMDKDKKLLTQNNLLNADFWRLLGTCIVDPVAVGFNMADIVILENLPAILKRLLQTALRFLDSAQMNSFYESMRSLLTSRDGKYNLYQIVQSMELSSPEEYHLFCTYLTGGYQLLVDVNVLVKTLPAGVMSSDLSLALTNTLLKASSIKVSEPSTIRLLEVMYNLALSIGVDNTCVIEMLFKPNGLTSYSLVEKVLLKYMTGKGSSLISSIMGKATSSPHKASSYIIGLLEYCRATNVLARQTQLVAAAVLDNWQLLDSWWRNDAAGAASTATAVTRSYCIVIIRKLILIGAKLEGSKNYPIIVQFFVQTITSVQSEQSHRNELLDVLPSFLSGTKEQTQIVRGSIQKYVNDRFPLSSSELPMESTGYHDYMATFTKILEAMVIDCDMELFKIMLGVACREESHSQENIIQEYIRRFGLRMRKLHSEKQLEALTICFKMFRDREQYGTSTIRVSALNRVCVPLLRRMDKVTIIAFFRQSLKDIQQLLTAKETKSQPDVYLVVIRDKICCYGLVELMYNSLLKEEVFSSDSALAQMWINDDPTAKAKADSWKNMTKDFISMSKDCKNEDMRGETLHLEWRRKLHCAAYSALMAIIANTQVESKFYRSFLFSGDAIKGCTPLENICPQEPYQFEVELSKLPVRTKQLISVRQFKDDEGETSDTVAYMQSVAESSLTEDLSKYDFSYSQSISTSKQRREEKEQEQLELLYPDSETVQPASTHISQGYVELESDPLNDHECMAQFTALLQHMLKNDITPDMAEQSDSLPGWMVWLREKMDNHAVAVNVKHFIARLILNNEKVFSPFSYHWLPSLVKYVKSCCEELHYFCVDVLVMIIRWCDSTTPQKEVEGKSMLNSLVEYIIEKAHHDRKGIFKNNLELLKACLERWKSFIKVSTRLIYDYLKSSDDKKVLTGIQILGVILANNIDPYNPSSCDVGKQAFYISLGECLAKRLLSVYSSASEVIGLVFNFLSSGDESSGKFCAQFEGFIEKGLSLATVPLGKLIVCLYSINLHYQPFSDRFMSKVLFEVQRLHGDMRQKGLEIIAGRIAHTEDPFKQLSNINFSELLAHRNSHIMQSCLKIFYNVLEKLSSDQTAQWLPLVADCQSSGDEGCRRQAHDIFISLHKKYSSFSSSHPSSAAADSSDSAVEERLFATSKECLLLALADSSQHNRLIVQNFWSAETTLPQEILPRLQAILEQMYSPSTETNFLSCATNLILELTSHSPDFDRPVFDTPLSDCKFEAYAVNATWTQRFSTLAPMFADGTASQSVGSSLGAVGLLRGTQATQQFTATLDPNDSRQKTYNWLTQSSLDTSVTDTPSTSSLFFTVGSKTSKPATSRSYSKSATNKAEVVSDQTDGKINSTDSNSELSALRRRFIKDQESSRVYFAKREARRKKVEQERRVSVKQQRENQVTLYRQYRIGDLPDIQIKHSAVITPLQALAQKDVTTARILFQEMFHSILASGCDGAGDVNTNIVKLVKNILSSSMQYHPPFIACLLELLEKLSSFPISTTLIADCGIQCKQQPIGVVTLEKKILSGNSVMTSESKKRKVDVEDSKSWINLVRLYKSMSNYDIVHSIVSSKITLHESTRQALDYESKHSYEKACEFYELSLKEEQSGQNHEVDLVDDARLHCMEQLTKWEDLESTLKANLGQDLANVWLDSTSKDYYLSSLMKCQTKLLMAGKDLSQFLEFINDSCKNKEQQQILELNYSDQLAIIYMASKDFGRAQHYYQMATEKFLHDWSTISHLMTNARSHNMQSLQKLAEMGEFLDLVRSSPDVPVACDLITRWVNRSPGELSQSAVWDDVVTNRIFYMNMLDSILDNDLFLENRLRMKLKQAAHTTTIGNIDLSLTILRGIRKEISEKDVGFDLKLQLTAAGIEIQQQLANRPDIPLSSRIRHTSAAVRAIDQYSDEADKALNPSDMLYYKWYSLKSKTWSCLLSGVLESTADALHSSEKDLLFLAECSEASQIVSSISKKALSCIKKSISTEADLACAHMDMVIFADHLLRHCEEAEVSVVSKDVITELTKNLVQSCTKALVLGSDKALGWVPRLLQLLEIYPDSVPVFKEQTKEVPCWMFLSWVSQIVAMLDSEHGAAVHHIVSNIADSYPMALIYSVKISLEDFVTNGNSKICQFIYRLRDRLGKFTLVDYMVRALEQLSQPDALFQEWVADVMDMFKSGKINTKQVETSFQQMYKNLFPSRGSADVSLYNGEGYVDSNGYRKTISKAFEKKVKELAGERGEKIIGLGAQKFWSKFGRICSDMKEYPQSPPDLIKDYSTWLANFNGELMDQQLEIPGQYGKGTCKPLPEYHVTISGFDEKVRVMTSLRKPKQITIRGNDEREYKFLVKGGEDLRLDQRIQTVFTNMNKMMRMSSSCQHLSLTTYSVIPMNTRLGLIEWMENVTTLKDVILGTFTELDENKYKSARNKYAGKYAEKKQVELYSTFSSAACRSWFTQLQDASPNHVLRKYLYSLSASLESFYLLREQCITSHATLSICHYLLGIGDRHLSNFMVDTNSATIVGIDFGHAFGSATTLLSIPELVPFRLTRQFTELMEPYGTQGLLHQTMCRVLTVMKENRRQLLNLLDIFIKEPSLDWMKNAKKQSKKAEFDDNSTDTLYSDDSENWYPKEKVKFAELKLLGGHPRFITAEEFKLNSHAAKQLASGLKHILPDSSVNKSLRLPVEEQVLALVDQAVDANLLGRIFQGWEPFV